MAVYKKDLKQLVLDNADKCSRIVIISGFATPDTIEEIARKKVEISFYYGMYRKRGLTRLTYKKLIEIDKKYDNLSVYIVRDYHVHTKCYLFLDKEKVINALVGSANCSVDGLSSGENSEMLVELNERELTGNTCYLKNLKDYAEEVKQASVKCGDPEIVINEAKTIIKKQKEKKGQYLVSTNPYIAYMPLFSWKKRKNGSFKKIVNKQSGLNWGLQSGHSKKGAGYAEAYLKVTGELVDLHPVIFPFFPTSRTTTSGKITRRFDPVIVLWDDGTIMEMIFSGNGVERPTKKKRKPGETFHQYPKQFTSGKDGDGGGAELGKYLRKRMNVPERHVITMKDLKDYGREYVELTYIHDGYYEADFSGTPLT